MARLPTVGGDSGDWGTVLNEYLQIEHNDDGTHKTDYLPLAGGTLSGDINADDHVVSQMEVKDYSETVVTADSGDAYTINLAYGNIVELTLTANCTITFSNPPAAGKAGSMTLVLHQDGSGSKTITWPASVKWPSATSPTLTTGESKVDIVQLFTTDGGTTWRGFLAGANFI